MGSSIISQVIRVKIVCVGIFRKIYIANIVVLRIDIRLVVFITLLVVNRLCFH